MKNQGKVRYRSFQLRARPARIPAVHAGVEADGDADEELQEVAARQRRALGLLGVQALHHFPELDLS